jgi:hypothetical protein
LYFRKNNKGVLGILFRQWFAQNIDDLAAKMMVVVTVLNLDEFVMKE